MRNANTALRVPPSFMNPHWFWRNILVKFFAWSVGEWLSSKVWVDATWHRLCGSLHGLEPVGLSKCNEGPFQYFLWNAFQFINFAHKFLADLNTYFFQTFQPFSPFQFRLGLLIVRFLLCSGLNSTSDLEMGDNFHGSLLKITHCDNA